MSIIRKRAKVIKFNKLIKSKSVIAFAAVFAVIGVVSLLSVFAAPGDIAIEAESGALVGNVVRSSDSTASNNQYISFGQPQLVSSCILANAVFCEDFETTSVSNNSRSGDFNSKKISASRLSGTFDNGGLSWVTRSLIQAGCRSGSITNPLPPADTLICNPNSTINSRHGLTAVAVQNYGDNYYRINQPFDFANRTGVISFDASIHHLDALWGAAAITLVDEPLSSTSIVDENGNGAPPRNGLVLHFNFFCRDDQQNTTMPEVRLYSNYSETKINDAEGKSNGCNGAGVKSRTDRLNRVELRVSQSKLEVWASDYSNDGVTFGALRKMYISPSLNLPFSRGWVSFGGHNHASIKYGGPSSINIFWDNIAFDGPAIATPTVYQIPDNGTLVSGGMALGHAFNNRNETLMPALTFTNVQKGSSESAKLSFNMWSENYYNKFTGRKVYYRLNDGLWHLMTLPEVVVSSFDARGASRANYLETVDMAEIRNGNNTIQFASDDMNHGYPSFVANIDLQIQ